MIEDLVSVADSVREVSRPRRLWSFQDVIEIEGHKIGFGLAHLSSFGKILELQYVNGIQVGQRAILIQEENMIAVAVAIQNFQKFSSDCGLGLEGPCERLLRQARKCCANLASVPIQEVKFLINHMEQLVFAVNDQLKTKKLFMLNARHLEFYELPNGGFGDGVADAFPSVIPDLAEASKCRALERWTACVMHMMRVLELGLRSLAKHCDVEQDENWNTILNQIEAKLRSVRKKESGRDAEQWASEAGTHLRFLKNAFRNHAMHPLERYDEERAVEIYDSTRSFMRHLATRLSE